MTLTHDARNVYPADRLRIDRRRRAISEHPRAHWWIPIRVGSLLLAFATLGGCGLLLDLDPRPPSVTPTQKAYQCTAQIYRVLGSSRHEFTEQWDAWVFANDENGDGAVDVDDGFLLCEAKLNEYVARAEAPGFTWWTRDLDVVEGRSDSTDPILRRMTASECSGDPVGVPFTTGGPRGAVVALDPPTTAQVAIDATLFRGGDRFDGDPRARRFVARFAERYGLPRLLPEGEVYFPYARHLRFSDALIEVQTPFTLGPVTVNQLYIQSVGTLYAGSEGDTPDPDLFAFLNDTLALDGSRQPGKFYFRASGVVEGESGTTSYCFTDTGFFRESPAAPPRLELEILETIPGTTASISVRVTIHLSSFDEHQPYVALADRDTSSLLVDLGSDPGSTIRDNDSDLSQCLWFQDFEQATERFLGVGRPVLSGVRVPPSPMDETGTVTPYELVAACYDSRGAYNVDLQRLWVRTPQAVDDTYTAREDTTLAAGPSQSVLQNDDFAGVPRVAILQTLPGNGTLDFRGDGTFTYTPRGNFAGTDAFTYAVDHDGLVITAPATVTIVVEAVPTDEEIGELEDELPDIVGDDLTDGQVNSLAQKLAQARAEVVRAGPDAITSSCSKLAAFINELEALVRIGSVPATVGDYLIGRANNIREELGCR